MTTLADFTDEELRRSRDRAIREAAWRRDPDPRRERYIRAATIIEHHLAGRVHHAQILAGILEATP